MEAMNENEPDQGAAGDQPEPEADEGLLQDAMEGRIAGPRRAETVASTRRYLILLALILTAFVIQGVVVDPSGFSLTLLTALLGATLVLSLRVGGIIAPIRHAAAALAVLLVLATAVQALTGGVDDGALRLSNALLVAVAPVAIVMGVIRRLRATQAVTVDAVIGVVCIYVLLGMFFAFAFGAINRYGAEPFFAHGASATISNCLYFSFTTLSTVGYGDFTAASQLGHTLSVSEALLGQVYLVTVVSLIVGNLGRRRTQ
jgi:hypothetical protein